MNFLLWLYTTTCFVLFNTTFSSLIVLLSAVRESKDTTTSCTAILYHHTPVFFRTNVDCVIRVNNGDVASPSATLKSWVA